LLVVKADGVQKHRYKAAQQYLDDAKLLLESGRSGSAVSRAYYSSYQAMWAVLGDPMEGKIWRHLGIIKHFVRGYWYQPDHPPDSPGLLEHLRLPLRRFYDLRIEADYDLNPIDMAVAERQIKLAAQVIQEIRQRLELEP